MSQDDTATPEQPDGSSGWGDPWRTPPGWGGAAGDRPGTAGSAYGEPPAPVEPPAYGDPPVLGGAPTHDYPVYGAPATGAPTYGGQTYGAPSPGAPAYDGTTYGGSGYGGPPSAGGPPAYGDPSPFFGVPAVAAAPAVRRPRRLVSGWSASVVVLALVAGLLGGIAGAWWSGSGSRATTDRSFTLQEPAPGSTSRPSGSVAGVAQRVLPSVVAIRVRSAAGAATGSGFVVRQDGYIVTNNHVVAQTGGGTITVIFQDGSHEKATVVGHDASYDLAAIKVKRTGLPVLEFGDSASVVVGDEVIAIGAPLGLQGTVTSGIVSAVNRPVTAGEGQSATAFINAIQTDAAINPGNSGGPLVDLVGRVVGVNSAIAQVPGGGSLGGQTGNIGLGFAIPSQQARRTVEQLIRTGRAQHPIIGVILDRTYTGEGVKISESGAGDQPPVTPGGPADKAGVKPGDVVTAFNGRPVNDADEFVVAIRAQAPGDEVRLTIRRDGRERTVTMTLQGSSD